ncbi:hypothetical protein B0T26DRAFT_701161 [Lasiosphaeria miniovina]|uniref:Uncharacterized protein n=1 Tax=Lasiosphaeria miniovina TaxID=1954250 RepID=A0AA40AU89_9PEZI|nr:uncharacterized protein B0T26DRAFT_701161 [Lasiosphaeria miniovina]KAK0722052.1 hypothetical protein B0T26DRAFT_701161 [Lasiosphaeria miniovina]
MGLTVAPPPPHLSDDVIPKFNLVHDTKETVQSAKFFAKETVNGAWAPEPQPKNAETKLDEGENPEVPHSDPDDSRGGEVEKRWKRVRTIWGDERNLSEEAVRRWADRLGFAPGVLTCKRPAALLKRFEMMVPALPVVAVGIS